MSRSFRIAYFVHSVRSDWNNGNAHFLRGLLREAGKLGHDVTIFEPEDEWSIANLRSEKTGARALRQFSTAFPDLRIRAYDPGRRSDTAFWRAVLRDVEIVILHEWNPPEIAQCLLELRRQMGFRLLFHDTHHRAASSPEQIRRLAITRFDGVLAFGEALRRVYRDNFGMRKVWTFHEAADIAFFRPLAPRAKRTDVVWIGNWGDGERSAEIREFLLKPARQLGGPRFIVYGVRYPREGLAALGHARVGYRGYLANLRAPDVYASSRLTVHIPRRQYASALPGVPTVRVFEALACGIPLLSAPWKDSEQLFREGDFRMVQSAAEMKAAMRLLLEDGAAADSQARRGLETVLARHTCRHRAQELTSICQELVP